MKLIYILLLLIPAYSFGQDDDFCAEKFKQGTEAADSLINAEIDAWAWEDWNVVDIGIRNVKYYRCEVENYYSYNSLFYQEYAELLTADSIFLFPYFNFYEIDCFVKGVKSTTDSILKLNGFDEQYFSDKKKAAMIKVDEFYKEYSLLTSDGQEQTGGKICEKYSGSIEKVIVDCYIQTHNSRLPPFYFTSYNSNNSNVTFTVSVNRRGVIQELTFGNFDEYTMRQNETQTQIELIKQIITQSLLDKQVFTPYILNGKRTKFKKDIYVTICWK